MKRVFNTQLMAFSPHNGVNPFSAYWTGQSQFLNDMTWKVVERVPEASPAGRFLRWLLAQNVRRKNRLAASHAAILGLITLSLMSAYGKAAAAHLNESEMLTPIYLEDSIQDMIEPREQIEQDNAALMILKPTAGAKKPAVKKPGSDIQTEEEEYPETPRDRNFSIGLASRGFLAPFGQQFYKMTLPMHSFMISSRFGWRHGRLHSGMDLTAPSGTPIYAAAPGQVVFSGWDGAYGRSLIIDHGNDVKTRYAHCSSLIAHEGQTVLQGQEIAKVGSTGRSTGPHLHFEVLSKGVARNPEQYIHH